MKCYNRPTIVILSLLLFSTTGLTSCSNDRNCQSAVDTVKIIDQKVIGNTEYYLVLRIAGWHDKTEIIELYDAKPSFDKCATSDIEPVYGDSLEMDKTVSHVFVDAGNNTLKIEYKDGEPSRAHNSELRIEVQKKPGS